MLVTNHKKKKSIAINNYKRLRYQLNDNYAGYVYLQSATFY